MKNIITFGCFVLLLCCLASCGNTSSAEETNEPTSEPTQEEVIEEAKVYTADTASMTVLFSDVVYDDCDESEFEVRWDEGLDCFIIFYLPPNKPWDETTFVRTEISNYINYCITAYGIDGVNNVLFNISAPMIDCYGQESTDVVMRLWMRRENFEKFNWDNLAYTNIYGSFYLDSEMFVISLENVDTEKVFYTPY